VEASVLELKPLLGLPGTASARDHPEELVRLISPGP
jgi:hypothetical protein